MKILKIILKTLSFILIFIVITILVIFFGSRLINLIKSRITTPNGIQAERYIELGNQQQFISIRGQNIENPVVIFLHGGPGSPMTYMTYNYQKDLERYLTFVNWDQRGCGRTFYANNKNNENLSQSLLSSDLDELVDYCRTFFNQEKVIIMAHSNGTTFGLEYVHNHPEKVSQYIGIGQLINARSGDFYAAEKALNSMEDNNPNKAKLQSALNKYRSQTNPDSFNLTDFITIRTLEAPYWKGENEWSNLGQMWSGISSPYMNLTDIKWFCSYMTNSNKIFEVEKSLMDYTFFDFDAYQVCGSYFETPVAFMGGEHDSSTPLALVEDYFATIEAPSKKLIKLPECGHMVFMDSTEEFTFHVKSILGIN